MIFNHNKNENVKDKLIFINRKFVKLTDNLVIRKNLIRYVKWYVDETEYFIEILYNGGIEIISFKNKKEMLKEYTKINKILLEDKEKME